MYFQNLLQNLFFRKDAIKIPVQFLKKGENNSGL
jgi:hypothetical protein